MDPVHNRGFMDPVHESSPWTWSKVWVHGPLVHVLSSPLEPRFNEVSRDGENLFVMSRVHYIENLNVTNFWDNMRNVCFMEV